MGREYIQLECGCLVSCDGGGGLIQGCDEGKNCKVPEYLKKHDMKFGWCPICHPIQYGEAMGEYKIFGNTNKYYKGN